MYWYVSNITLTIVLIVTQPLVTSDITLTSVIWFIGNTLASLFLTLHSPLFRLCSFQLVRTCGCWLRILRPTYRFVQCTTEATVETPLKPDFQQVLQCTTHTVCFKHLATCFMSQCLTCNSTKSRHSRQQFYFPRQFRKKFQSVTTSTHPPTPTNMSHTWIKQTYLMDNDTPASSSHKAKATTFAEAIARSWNQ